MNPEIEAKLRLCPRLPTLSGVALRVVTAARQPNVDLEEITTHISKDPALATKMLRVANSSLYQNAATVRTIRQAVQLLGLDATIALSLSFSLAHVVEGYDETRIDLERFWRRALLSGLAARLLGEHLALKSAEELFLAGMVQDIGMLALDATLPDRYATAALEPEIDHDDLTFRERDRLAIDHLEAGAWLMRIWHLPEYLVLATLGSHDLGRRIGRARLTSFMGCVATSGRIAEMYLSDASEDMRAKARHAASACLDLSNTEFDDIIERMDGALPEIEDLFETPVLPALQAHGLADQAHELLVAHNSRRLRSVSGQQTQVDDFKQIADQLYDVAHRDALTGIYNRRHFDEALGAAFEEAAGQRHPLSVAFMDLDYFKNVNDEYGHGVGDTLLTAVAKKIQECLRPNDLLARYGGEEFVILMPGLGHDAAYSVIDRVRIAVEQYTHTLETGETINVTLSAGVATHEEGPRKRRSAAELMHAADKALYDVKRDGRNRVARSD